MLYEVITGKDVHSRREVGHFNKTGATNGNDREEKGEFGGGDGSDPKPERHGNGHSGS